MKIRYILPGIISCLTITIIAKILTSFIPNIGTASLSILVGIIMGNTIFKSPIYNDGLRFCEKDLLSLSIVFMGATLNINSIAQIGFKGIIFIILQMALTILVSLKLGEIFKFNNTFRILMASGNAVCGSSAIGATADAINADKNDKSLAITVVNLVGTILMFILPVICSYLYSRDLLHSSAMIGGILQSVGQVLASASFLGKDFVNLATIFKIIRIIFIVIVVIIMSQLNKKYETNLDKNINKNSNQINNKKRIYVPWFITGFFILSCMTSMELTPNFAVKYCKILSSNFEIIALAAIGANVKIHELIKEGPKALTFGIIIGLSQIIFAITLISIIL